MEVKSPSKKIIATTNLNTSEKRRTINTEYTPLINETKGKLR
jgi:hypothetical protein